MGAGCTTGNNVIRASTASLRQDEVVPQKILILGPSDAGKTYLLYSWVLGSDGVYSTKPTEEYNVEKITTKSGTSFTMWDVTGNPGFRPHHKRRFYDGIQGVIFVFDVTSDLKLAKEDLDLILTERALKDVPLLFVANQLEDPDSVSNEILLSQLCKESKLSGRKWGISRVRTKSQEDIEQVLSDLEKQLNIS